MNFAQRLEDLIELNGTSRGAVARFVGVHTSTVTNWLKGMEPKIDKVTKVAEFFDVPVSYLMGWEDAVSDLNKVGMSEFDVAEEMGIDPSAFNEILSSFDASSAEAVSKIIAVASLIAKEKTPTLQPESERIPNYSKLSETNRAIVDSMIAQLLAAQSNDQ